MKKYLLCLPVIMISLFANAQVPISRDVKKNITPNKNIQPGKIQAEIKFSQVTATPATITGLCPWQKSRGDNDFADNPVRVSVNINLYMDRSDSTKIMANISIGGRENAGDASTVKGVWKKVVYTAPAGWSISNFTTQVGDLVSYFEFDTDMSVRPDIDACKQRIYSFTKDNFGFHIDKKILQDIEIAVHSTRDDTVHRSGEDFDEIEGTCNCGFRVKSVSFKPLQVMLAKK